MPIQLSACAFLPFPPRSWRSCPSRSAAWLLAAVLIVAAASARAQPDGALVIDIDAPAELRALLRQHVDVAAGGATLQDEGERLRVTRQARKQITELLATEGYFTPEIEVVAEGAGKRLKVSVLPGRRAEVRSLDIEFTGDIAQASPERLARVEALRRGWSLPAGRPFRQQAWDAAKQDVLRQLLAEDYPAAAIADSRAEVDPEGATVALRVVYDSGPPFTLGRLEVSGLDKFSADLVERHYTIRPGERYSQERLLQLQSALQNTPYFSSVVVDIDNDPAHAAEVPVRVHVREARTKRMGVGAGYSSNTGAHVELTFRHTNLLDRAWNLMSGVRLDQKRQFGYADIHLPPTEKDYRDSVGVLAESTDIEGLSTRRVAAGAVRARTRGRIETRLSLNLQREQTDAEGGTSATSTALTLNYSWTYRDVDNLLDPRHGYVLNLQAGGAAKALLSDQTFARFYGRYQHYLPVGELDAVVLRAELGYTAAGSLDGIPQDSVFRTGGAQSVRGYSYQSLGVPDGNAVVGGRKLAVGSMEYVHWFDRQWGGALFYDAGNAWDTSDQTRLFSGYGLGARWRSPAGPLALDVAYGQGDQQVRVHFSVAIAF